MFHSKVFSPRYDSTSTECAPLVQLGPVHLLRVKASQLSVFDSNWHELDFKSHSIAEVADYEHQVLGELVN